MVSFLPIIHRHQCRRRWSLKFWAVITKDISVQCSVGVGDYKSITHKLVVAPTQCSYTTLFVICPWPRSFNQILITIVHHPPSIFSFLHLVRICLVVYLYVTSLSIGGSYQMRWWVVATIILCQFYNPFFKFHHSFNYVCIVIMTSIVKLFGSVRIQFGDVNCIIWILEYWNTLPNCIIVIVMIGMHFLLLWSSLSRLFVLNSVPTKQIFVAPINHFTHLICINVVHSFLS